MRAWLGWCGLALVVSACGSSTTNPACIPGSTQVCFCVSDVTGVQSCLPDRTFGACDCSGITPLVDGGPGVDAAVSDECPDGLTSCGDRCVDTSTDEAHCGGCGPATACADGSFCVSGVCQDVAGCPPPFVECSGECIDPRSSAEFCGASGACTGSSAGRACGGACREGRCVYESCDDVLDQGASTGDGLYLVDIDGTGPIPARDVYCDMTTEGGGWTLVYRVRNDVPDIADPWWGMIALGSGDALPTSASTLPAGTHFEGPTRDVRGELYARQREPDVRVTLLSAAGDVLVDVAGRTERLLHLVRGDSGVPTSSSCPQFVTLRVIAAASSEPFDAGAGVPECFSQGASLDRVFVGIAPDIVPLFGDSSVAEYGARYANSTTLFWVRRIRP